MDGTRVPDTAEHTPAARTVIDRGGLDQLVAVLRADGYRVIGPKLDRNAIVLGELDSGDDLPDGWGVTTAPGQYRVHRRDDDAVFGHSSGPQSWKQYLHPPRRPLWSTDQDGTFRPPPDEEVAYAFLGVRGCDLAAIRILRTVLCGGGDGRTAAMYSRLFVVAVDCTEPGGVCFCASMGTGPGAAGDYDLRLTERLGHDGPHYLADSGTDRGATVLARLQHREADRDEVDQAARDVAAAADRMGRRMPDVDLRALLRTARDADVWDEVASRCLTCGNCTMVCPTCFCTTVEDVTDLTGGNAERWQRWASCFEPEFSHLHGGDVRVSGQSRYRQWISHKLGTWHDQFGSSGCVGCGRCIDWCPVGIDITQEAARLAEMFPDVGDYPGEGAK
ncbi:NiFe hydrogenase beta subunit [Rhodococcus sp. RD6.2]|uniref:4Fe-4S dicluster domain-containing protein n=1 Tax=Rhodococcus sp. RD6.2 TaxID=260936 RepID=UPI00063BAD8E|nr:4Fe-4S dicluster domain-containing protein [Rhodococcus sp. RD6.2]CRK51226.1 NiFe hydrogenase beta subunit [Rhodococcus sp. RD6.2]